jgi:hypothetical protein
MEMTLYEIAWAVEIPLLIDNVTKNIMFGHYARVLVDLDLSKDIFFMKFLLNRRALNSQLQ